MTHISFPYAFIFYHFKSKAGGCWICHVNLDQSVEILITGNICQLSSLTQRNAFLNGIPSNYVDTSLKIYNT